jgi:hypothetical protein
MSRTPVASRLKTRRAVTPSTFSETKSRAPRHFGWGNLTMCIRRIVPSSTMGQPRVMTTAPRRRSVERSRREARPTIRAGSPHPPWLDLSFRFPGRRPRSRLRGEDTDRAHQSDVYGHPCADTPGTYCHGRTHGRDVTKFVSVFLCTRRSFGRRGRQRIRLRVCEPWSCRDGRSTRVARRYDYRHEPC